MKAVFALISRNRKLFFKDRGMFFSALITPGILILLYATFLANVYRDSFVSAIPDMITISDKLVDGTVAAQLAAALLAADCSPSLRRFHGAYDFSTEKFRRYLADTTVLSAGRCRNLKSACKLRIKIHTRHLRSFPLRITDPGLSVEN